jgi:hypothetical protein
LVLGTAISIKRRYSDDERDELINPVDPLLLVRDEVAYEGHRKEPKAKSTKGKKSKNQEKKYPVKTETKEKIKKEVNKRKWTYYKDDPGSEEADPYSTDGDSDWEPKVNENFVKQFNKAVTNKTRFWCNPDDLYID